MKPALTSQPHGETIGLPPVATGSNRINSSGLFGSDAKSRTSQFYANVVPAGGTLPVPVAGNYFYVTLSTAVIEIRPAGGVFNEYPVGTGLDISKQSQSTFNLIEVHNPNAFPITFQVFIGFGEFIDKRLILNNQQQPNVAYPTNPQPLTTTNINIIDRSGSIFQDIDGESWAAIFRVAIVISNMDVSANLVLQKLGSVVSTGPAIIAIFPQQSIRLDVSGDYCLNVGGGNINAIVSEIYQAVQPF